MHVTLTAIVGIDPCLEFSGTQQAVWLRDGPTILGTPRTVAESVDTDDLDVYLLNPWWVDPDGSRREVTGVLGIWVAARDIRFIQVLDSNEPARRGLRWYLDRIRRAVSRRLTSP